MSSENKKLKKIVYSRTLETIYIIYYTMTPRPMLRNVYNKVIQLSKRVFELPKKKTKELLGFF